MAVATETRTDTQIQTDVLAELKWEPRIAPNEIGVIVKDGVVKASDICAGNLASKCQEAGISGR